MLCIVDDCNDVQFLICSNQHLTTYDIFGLNETVLIGYMLPTIPLRLFLLVQEVHSSLTLKLNATSCCLGLKVLKVSVECEPATALGSRYLIKHRWLR